MVLETSQTLRPGGLKLTQQIFNGRRLRYTRALDIGCGQGATVRWLNAKGCRAYGVDINIAPNTYPHLIQGNADNLPFNNDIFNYVLMECTFSQLENPQKALKEVKRVLTPNGLFIMSDLYARQNREVFNGLLGNLYCMSDILIQTQEAGFIFQDFKTDKSIANSYFAEMVYHYGIDGASKLAGGTPAQIKSAKCGYFIATFKI